MSFWKNCTIVSAVFRSLCRHCVPEKMILFGGGWKNPIVRESFENLLAGKAFVLPEHQAQFAELYRRLESKPAIRISELGDYMEARLFADMARYKLENKAWEIPEIIDAGKSVVCGKIVSPGINQEYNDRINRAAKGWQAENTVKD